MPALPKNLDSLNVKQLSKLQNDATLAMARKIEQAEKAIPDISAKLAAMAAEIVAARGLPPVTAEVSLSFKGAKNGHAKKRTKHGRKAVAIKYRDPAHPENTWTGRGRMPRWMTAAGGNKQQFAVTR